jgi:hypothetical protein
MKFCSDLSFYLLDDKSAETMLGRLKLSSSSQILLFALEHTLK